MPLLNAVQCACHTGRQSADGTNRRKMSSRAWQLRRFARDRDAVRQGLARHALYTPGDGGHLAHSADKVKPPFS
jgi:hypothetical protein